MKFGDLNLDPGLFEGIQTMGFDIATPVQEKTIPVILEGKDIIASAQTGTGKTAAYLIPVIQKIIDNPGDKGVKALVIVPTRELAIQIDQHMEALSYFTNVSSIAVYGGTDGVLYSKEKNVMSGGIDIVIATPGRVITHLNMGNVNMKSLKYFILDEADRMLDMGFYTDIMKIISFLPEKRQNLLFSATMPPKIKELARKVLNAPEEINIAVARPVDKVLQVAYVLFEKQKLSLLKYIIKSKHLRSTLIFCSTKIKAKQMAGDLKNAGFSVEDIHSDLDQKTREKVLKSFRAKTLGILVATDILSRGIDIEDIDLVVNYDVPNDGEDYIHRIGRTARAESDGVAITFVSQDEQNRFASIEKLLGEPVFKARLPDHIGESPEYNPGRYMKGGNKRRSSRKQSFRNKGRRKMR